MLGATASPKIKPTDTAQPALTPPTPERWEERFAKEGYSLGEQPNVFLKNHAHLFKPNQKVLVIADGAGRNSVFLAGLQGLSLEVVATECSPDAIRQAKTLAERHNVSVETHEVDIFNWEYPSETFDAVVLIFAQVGTRDDHEALFKNIDKTLKPGGLLLSQGYRPEQITNNGTGGPKLEECMYTEEMLLKSFGHFSSTKIKSHTTELNEGTSHLGSSELIDLVACK